MILSTNCPGMNSVYSKVSAKQHNFAHRYIFVCMEELMSHNVHGDTFQISICAAPVKSILSYFA